MDEVILVSGTDEEIGKMEKLEAHQKGLLHRAFSVFIFNPKNELLLQQRALNKYHSAGLWTNTCCSHPRPGEKTDEAAARRLKEEMGLSCELKQVNEFIYKIKFENGLTEYEYDHLFLGQTEEEPVINPDEVRSFKWMTIEAIKSDLNKHPNHYTFWFKLAIDKVFAGSRM